MTLEVSSETGELIKLIWEGRRRLISPGGGRHSPLQEAAGTGFHSMVELLLEAGLHYLAPECFTRSLRLTVSFCSSSSRWPCVGVVIPLV
jgi:hypothetical protein